MDWLPWILMGLIFGWATWSYRNLGHEMDAHRAERKVVKMTNASDADAERADIRNRFAFHPSTAATGPKHDEVRAQHRALALWVLAAIPPSRERSLALTALQEAMMWANAAVAIHTEPEPLRPGLRDEG